MTENNRQQQSSLSGFFSSYVRDQRPPSLDDFGGSAALAQINPYTADFRYLSSPTQQPQFIIPEGQVEKRGRLELMFFTIGGAVLSGGLFGGTNGLYSGLKSITSAENAGLARGLKRTMILNYMTKHGTAGSSSFGSLALLYSLLGVAVSKARGNVDDELNTVAAGTLAAALFRSTKGLEAASKAGLVGFVLSGAYVAATFGRWSR